MSDQLFAQVHPVLLPILVANKTVQGKFCNPRAFDFPVMRADSYSPAEQPLVLIQKLLNHPLADFRMVCFAADERSQMCVHLGPRVAFGLKAGADLSDVMCCCHSRDAISDQ